MPTVELRGDSYDSFLLCVDGFTEWMIARLTLKFGLTGETCADLLVGIRAHISILYYSTLPRAPIGTAPGVVLQFQAQCKRLPASLRTWEAYLELKKTIDDFLELQVRGCIFIFRGFRGCIFPFGKKLLVVQVFIFFWFRWC